MSSINLGGNYMQSSRNDKRTSWKIKFSFFLLLSKSYCDCAENFRNLELFLCMFTFMTKRASVAAVTSALSPTHSVCCKARNWWKKIHKSSGEIIKPMRRMSKTNSVALWVRSNKCDLKSHRHKAPPSCLINSYRAPTSVPLSHF